MRTTPLVSVPGRNFKTSENVLDSDVASHVMLRMVPVDLVPSFQPAFMSSKWKREVLESTNVPVMRTQNGKYLHTPEEPLVESLLTQLADELLVKDITEPSVVLGTLSDDELQAACDDVLEQFALELLIGAHNNSDWLDGKLVIDANHGPIHLLQTAFYAVWIELRRRKLACC